LARSRVLKDIPLLRFGEGRDCTLPACLAIASGGDYDWVMGVSGAAFTATIDAATWDPLAAAPLDDATLSRAAQAVGMKPDVVGPPFDDEMRALVFDRVAQARMPFFARPIVRKVRESALSSFIGPQLKLHLDYLEAELGHSTWFVGEDFTAADIQMSFPLEIAVPRAGLDERRPHLMAFLRRIHERPAYRRALERGGKYDYA